ncbi:MAG: peptidylprolyl isomerase [Candidatus Omnitrophica bacterium]|nr:peptidylprolyl isomerase [Candidatus Omnitrophota bacterium]
MKYTHKSPFALASFAVFISAASIFLVTGCAKKEAQGKILASYDGGSVSETEFLKAVRSMPEHIRTVAQEKKSEFLDSFITERLLLQEAEAKGIQHLTDVQDIIRQSRNRVLVTKLIEQEVDQKLEITDAEIKTYYDNHTDEFVVPYRLRASHILVRDRAEAESVISRIKAGELFEELAKKYSMDPTAAKGGDLGYVRKGQLIPEVEEALFGLKVGDMSDVVPSKFGFHILKVTGEAKPQTKELRLVEKDIRDRLTLEKRSQAFTGLIDRLKKKAGIKMNTEELEKLDFSADQPAA